jgi:hypothetical protein
MVPLQQGRLDGFCRRRCSMHRNAPTLSAGAQNLELY